MLAFSFRDFIICYWTGYFIVLLQSLMQESQSTNKSDINMRFLMAISFASVWPLLLCILISAYISAETKLIEQEKNSPK